MPKTETRGRPRIGKEITTPICLAVSPELKEALKDEAYRAGKSTSRMGAYAIQRWLDAQKHVRQIEKMKTHITDRNIIKMRRDV